MTHYVYLDTNINRLLITTTQLDPQKFSLLLSSSGNFSLGLTQCKLYCIGYIAGSLNKPPINDINEFN
jgi:hypothetical protein